MTRNYTVKYTFLEILRSIRKEPLIIILMVLCIICSNILLLFYFGYVHHAEQKKLDGESGEKEFYVYFYDPSWPLEDKQRIVKENKVKKGELIEWVLGLDEKILEDVEITLECKLEDDVVADLAIDNSSLSLATEFIVRKGRILPPDNEESLKSKNFLTEGRYFTDDDYLNEELVCLPPAFPSGNFRGEYEYLEDRYTQKPDGSYLIDGKKYMPVGVLESFTAIPDVPVTTIRDDVFVKNITFVFGHVVTRYEYETIANELIERYGEQAMVSELDIKTADSKSFDSMIYMMIAAVSVIASILVAFLYDYMITRCIECIRVFGLCGMTGRQISGILVNEAVILSGTACVAGGLLYHFLIMPLLRTKFEYIGKSAVLSVYLVIDMLFLTVCYIFTKIDILRRYN